MVEREHGESIALTGTSVSESGGEQALDAGLTCEDRIELILGWRVGLNLVDHERQVLNL